VQKTTIFAASAILNRSLEAIGTTNNQIYIDATSFDSPKPNKNDRSTLIDELTLLFFDGHKYSNVIFYRF
jgi:hypothetical protein